MGNGFRADTVPILQQIVSIYIKIGDGFAVEFYFPAFRDFHAWHAAQNIPDTSIFRAGKTTHVITQGIAIQIDTRSVTDRDFRKVYSFWLQNKLVMRLIQHQGNIDLCVS